MFEFDRTGAPIACTCGEFSCPELKADKSLNSDTAQQCKTHFVILSDTRRMFFIADKSHPRFTQHTECTRCGYLPAINHGHHSSPTNMRCASSSLTPFAVLPRSYDAQEVRKSTEITTTLPTEGEKRVPPPSSIIGGTYRASQGFGGRALSG